MQSSSPECPAKHPSPNLLARKPSILLLAFGAMAVDACSPEDPSAGGCDHDADCPGESYCLNEQCVEACEADDDCEEPPGGDGDLGGQGGMPQGTGGLSDATGGSEASTGGQGTGGGWPVENPEECSGGDLGLGGESSMGGAENYPDSIFVEAGRGTSGIWDGYLFTYASEQSQIEPNCFSTSRVCVNGTVGSDYEEFALVGWSIAQDIDPETHLGGNLHAISPGGTGVHVEVHNNLGSQLRVQIQADPSASEFWCAPVPFSGEGNIPWSDFHKECWTTGGEPYDGVTPIVQISVQVPSSGFEDSFDLCVVDISSY